MDHTEKEQLQQAINHLESQRSLLGDAVVEAALSPLREKLRSLAEPQSATEQRKQVTVLFADVSGFTALSESLDPEMVRDTMNALWHRLDAVITAHGGTIDKHIGDAVMGLWGVSAVREDDPEQAIRAGLEMQAELARLSENMKAKLGMRIGINTGPALLGAVGTTREFTAMGDTINTASRLQNQAPVGGVLISHDTYRLVRGIFDVQPNQAMAIKGKKDPVQTYVVQRAKPLAFRMARRGVEGIETRMVGRDVELINLQDLLKGAVEDSRFGMVTICGEAGVGKSRLIYEFENWLELQPETVMLFKTRASQSSKSLPFRLLRDMLAYRFQILESDGAQMVMEKFRKGMAGILEPEKADLVGQLLGFDFRSSPSVSGLLGSSSFGRMAELYLLNYFKQVFSQPGLMLLEDIHWADLSSLEFVKKLKNELKDLPLLVVCLARPIIFERTPEWCDDHRRINLQPLSGSQSRELVSQLLQKVNQMPERLKQMIVEGAEGNPYYVEELVKMLMDSGVIVRGEEEWAVSDLQLEKFKVPPTLTGILQSRLDGLPGQERNIIQRASVVGRRFWDAALSVIRTENEKPDTALTPSLDSLERRELVFKHSPSSFVNCQEFIFKHALLRDVAYETVLIKNRKRFHAQVALWLEVNAGERLAEYLGLIAQHYELAGEGAKAARYLRKQANGLYRLSSYREALVLYQRSLELCPAEDAKQRAVINTHIGNCLRQLSDFQGSREHHSRALTLARETDDQKMQINALYGLSWALMGQGRYDEAKKNLELALAQACRIDDKRGKARVLYHLGDISYRQGDSQATTAYGKECLALYQELNDKQGIAGALRVLGFSYFMQGLCEESFHYQTQSKSMYAQIGDRWGVASGLTNQGECTRRMGRFKEAEGYYQESQKVYEEMGSRLGLAISVLNLGHVHTAMGNGEKARSYFRHSAELSMEIGAHSVLLEVLAGVALLEARDRKFTEAAEILGAIQAHREYNDEIRANAEPVFTLIKQNLDAQKIDELLSLGKSREIGPLIKKLQA
jgi:class 3 adenylate cyclase/tetratricopeptide (TPR) repeat protein